MYFDTLPHKKKKKVSIIWIKLHAFSSCGKWKELQGLSCHLLNESAAGRKSEEKKVSIDSKVKFSENVLKTGEYFHLPFPSLVAVPE